MTLDSAEALIALLGMQPHPEGGHYVETFREGDGEERRAHVSAIYFLLRDGERSHWHRVDATEIWLWHAGAPLVLGIDKDEIVLGGDFAAGQTPQAVVPKHAWQSAHTLGDWTLVSCVVAPGFLFEGFELAAKGFAP